MKLYMIGKNILSFTFLVLLLFSVSAHANKNASNENVEILRANCQVDESGDHVNMKLELKVSIIISQTFMHRKLKSKKSSSADLVTIDQFEFDSGANSIDTNETDASSSSPSKLLVTFYQTQRRISGWQPHLTDSIVRQTRAAVFPKSFG